MLPPPRPGISYRLVRASIQLKAFRAADAHFALAQCSTDSVGGETCTFLGEVLSLTRISSYVPSWGPQNLSDTANLIKMHHMILSIPNSQF